MSEKTLPKLGPSDDGQEYVTPYLTTVYHDPDNIAAGVLAICMDRVQIITTGLAPPKFYSPATLIIPPLANQDIAAIGLCEYKREMFVLGETPERGTFSYGDQATVLGPDTIHDKIKFCPGLASAMLVDYMLCFLCSTHKSPYGATTEKARALLCGMTCSNIPLQDIAEEICGSIRGLDTVDRCIIEGTFHIRQMSSDVSKCLVGGINASFFDANLHERVVTLISWGAHEVNKYVIEEVTKQARESIAMPAVVALINVDIIDRDHIVTLVPIRVDIDKLTALVGEVPKKIKIVMAAGTHLKCVVSADMLGHLKL